VCTQQPLSRLSAVKSPGPLLFPEEAEEAAAAAAAAAAEEEEEEEEVVTTFRPLNVPARVPVFKVPLLPPAASLPRFTKPDPRVGRRVLAFIKVNPLGLETTVVFGLTSGFAAEGGGGGAVVVVWLMERVRTVPTITEPLPLPLLNVPLELFIANPPRPVFLGNGAE